MPAALPRHARRKAKSFSLSPEGCDLIARAAADRGLSMSAFIEWAACVADLEAVLEPGEHVLNADATGLRLTVQFRPNDHASAARVLEAFHQRIDR